MDHSIRPAPEPKIALQPVKSTNIAAAGYDPSTQVFDVQFANGRRYRYRDVPPEVADAFQAADSKGRFFAEGIRGQFPGSLLNADEPQRA